MDNTLNTVLLVAALVSGALTIVFILGSLRKITGKSSGQRLRGLLAALFFSLITGVLTVLQLLSTAQQLNLR
jgi:asparagine N-glycosylation enzyme membrane subunit Stt3